MTIPATAQDTALGTSSPKTRMTEPEANFADNSNASNTYNRRV